MRSRPITTNALPPLAEAQEAQERRRRQRQRLYGKRAYYKKLMEIQAQRDYAWLLETEYSLLANQKRDVDARLGEATHATSSPRSGDELALATTTSPRHHQFEDVCGTIEMLRMQNETLRRRIEKHEQFGDLLAAHTDWLAGSSTIGIDGPALAPQWPPRLVAPLSVEFCHRVTREALVTQMHCRQMASVVSTGATIFGWRDARVRVDDRGSFSLEKRFQQRLPVDLLQRAWSLFTSTEAHVALYAPSLDCRFATLQVVDDDNYIMLRQITSADGMSIAKTLLLLTRLAIPTGGFMIIARSIDPSAVTPAVLPPGVTETWVDHCAWITFQVSEPADCLVMFEGQFEIIPVSGTNEWMLELLFIMLRMEANAFDSRFLRS